MRHDTDSTPLRQFPGDSARTFLGAGRPGAARSLYIHVPFCFHKCHYCDFYSIVDTRDRQEAFTDRLIRELIAIAPLAGDPLWTVFVGGGTPTLLRTDLWERLLDTLHRHWAISPETEFTVECNPETATPELFGVLAGGGVNRISVGAQSFDPAHLKTLERWHDPASVGRALELAREAGIGRRSIDLIYAIPGQTTDELASDLRTALALPVDHLSAYALTYEPGTAMTARLERGLVHATPDDLEARMLSQVLETVRSHGFERYEVSNFALPGAECRHNLAYWRQDNWLAAGPSASGHLDGRRWKNTPRLDTYLGFDDAGFAPIVDHETPDAARNLAERIMTGIRLHEGLDAPGLLQDASAIGPGASDRLRRQAERHRSNGWLEETGPRWRLTDAGYLFADRVAGDLMHALSGV
ncbi:MAG: radical SAM family heme chaperone HemW [Phycisphaerales bacterium JB040]